MPGGLSCRGRSLLPLADPKFVRGRKNPASRGRKCAASGVSEVVHQRPAKDNSGKPRLRGLDRGAWRLELARLHTLEKSLHLGGIDAPRSEVLGGLGAARDREPQTLLRRSPVVAPRDEAGQEGITGADGRDGL